MDFSAGLGDALLLGFGDELRDLLGIDGVNRCSEAYGLGEIASLAAGTGRLAYAGAAKGISMLPQITGAQASAARNVIKRVARGGLFPNARVYPYDRLLQKYGSDAAVKAAAGRTDNRVNALGAAVAAAAALNPRNCGC